VAGVVAIAGVAAHGATRAMLTSSLLTVGRVTVRGNVRLATPQVEALVDGLQGQHILQVDLEVFRRRLMESPWVAGAMLRRVLPGTVEISVLERTPMAIARVGERLYLVDHAGVVVDEFGPRYQDFDLPVVDGLAPSPGDGPPVVDGARAQLARAFLAAVRGAGALGARVSQVDVSNDRDVVVLLADDPTVVHLGDARFVERLHTYLELAPALEGRLREIDYVDMRFDERVYVKSKGRHMVVGDAAPASGRE
jgi:cell division protein FtsQ